MSAPLYDCEAGFWCVSGAEIATPNDGITGIECPVGQYCTSGQYYNLKNSLNFIRLLFRKSF